MITITEKPWFIEIETSLSVNGTEKIAERLKPVGDYQVKTFDGQKGQSEEKTINTTKVIGSVIQLPKGKLGDANEVLEKLGEEVTVVLTPHPEVNVAAVGKRYPNPALVNDPAATDMIRLEPLQMKTLIDGLAQERSGAYDYGMGGGKTVLIAAILAAYPDLRPAIVTSAASGDSQQLASKIAVMTGEKVNLQGCTSGKLTAAQKRQLFVKKAEQATIICGSHALYGKLEKESAEESAVVKALETAKLIIIDEAHEFCTLMRIGALVKTKPQVVIGLTATWQKNWSKLDRLLADLLATTRKPLGVVSHTQVQETGRVTPMEVYGYYLDRKQWPIPTSRIREWRGYNLMQQEVEFHAGRNIFVAHMCNHIVETNVKENRGCVLVFGLTIGHCRRVVKELCAIRGIKYSEEALELDSIYVYNSQLSDDEKQRRMQAMAEGKTRIVFSTESLSRGIDMNTIADVVDINGGSKIVQLIQKSGRAVRPDGQEKVARVHTVMEMVMDDRDGRDKFILESCSKAKIKALESNFGVRAKLIFSSQVPWNQHATANR